MRIVTELVHNHNGTAQVRAKGAGKQRTIAYDHALSHERNHGLAAGTLALVLIQGDTARRLAAETAKHRQMPTGGKHEFVLGV